MTEPHVQESSVILTTFERDTLRALPDPGAASLGLRAAVRASDLKREGLGGYLWLHRLQEQGLAVGRKGWWKKTRAGVLYLRERGE